MAAFAQITLGETIKEDSYIAPMIDARRMEVYTAFFDHQNIRKSKIEPHIFTEDSFKEISQPIVLCGDGCEKAKDLFASRENIEMKKTIVLYWPKAGNVEKSAKNVAARYGDIEIKPIDEVNTEDLQSHDNYILGCSTVGAATWDSSENKDPWPAFFKACEQVGISEKNIALFGLGDQVRWPDHFVDGLSIIYEQIKKQSKNIVGKWSVKGYDHVQSEAQEGDYFVGLALDEDQQEELSDERIEKWIKQIKAEF
ncbi:MAG: hypothetical protein B7C24_09340 [Bacteroidetes bacterium 4572_77]|nr:MAG: hypothetical protein B7C24_09340 [Bacteroidetes bacterium 4572_77]